MKVLMIDAIGSFTKAAVETLREGGHDVVESTMFQGSSDKDVVHVDWADENAVAASQSPHHHLSIRLHGYELNLPVIREIRWKNVNALVVPSQQRLKALEKQVPDVRMYVDNIHISPAIEHTFGLKAAEVPDKGNIAIVGRIAGLKGIQSIMQVVCACPNRTFVWYGAVQDTRLLDYIEHHNPGNLEIVGDVDHAELLQRLGAGTFSHLLHASATEGFSVGVFEAAALGLQPVIHNFPGCEVYPESWLWFQPEEADILLDEPPERAQIAAWVDRCKKATLPLASIIMPANIDTVKPYKVDIRKAASDLFVGTQAAIEGAPLEVAEETVLAMRRQMPPDEFADEGSLVALQLAVRAFNSEDHRRARLWAMRSMFSGPSRNALGLLGMISTQGDRIEEAADWFSAAAVVGPRYSKYPHPEMFTFAELREFVEKHQEIIRPSFDDGKLPPAFHIVIPVHNFENLIERTLESVRIASPVPVHVIVTDSASDDKTLEHVWNWKEAHPEISLTIRQAASHHYSLQNIVGAIREAEMYPDDVIVILDGDDTLAPDALTRVARAYEAGAWMTYGSYVERNGTPGWARPYPVSVHAGRTYRKHPFLVTHLRTFKRALFDKIPEAALTLDGQWPEMSGDVAVGLACIELAGQRAFFVPEVLYVYSTGLPTNDHEKNPGKQVAIRDAYMAKEPLPLLDSLD